MKRIDYDALLPKVILGEAIPKVIYQTYKSRTALAPEFAENIEYLKRLNPNWEHELFDDTTIEQFIREEYGEGVWGYYQKISPIYGAARADFFRYLLIYRRGGVYLDIKSSIIRPLDEILDGNPKYLLYHWDNAEGAMYHGFGYFADLPRERFPYGEYSQWMITAVAGHPLLRAVIIAVMGRLDMYNPFTDGVGLRGVLRTTGPILYSLTIEQILPTLSAELVQYIRCSEEIGFRYSVLDAGGAFAHRQKVNSYNARLTAVSLNGAERWTKYLYSYFWLRWASEVFMDKVRAHWRSFRS